MYLSLHHIYVSAGECVIMMPNCVIISLTNQGHLARNRYQMAMLLLVSAAAGQTANLAVLWRRENGGMSGILWDQVSCAAVLAVNHFNARNGSIVPEFASVPPGLQLNGMYYDAWSTGKRAIMAYRKAIADGAHIISGPSRTAQAIPISQLAAVDEVVMNSFWASSPKLSDTAVHTTIVSA